MGQLSSLVAALAKRSAMKSVEAAMPQPPSAVTNAQPASPTTSMLRDPAAFFAEYRRQFGRLTTLQVEGLNFLLEDCSAAGWGLAWTAYGLATAKWETAGTLQPVREAYWKSEEWRRRNLRYFPWYGRGYVQLTWRGNYEAMGRRLGVDLLGDRDLAMDPDIAGDIMVDGMQNGVFTGKSLDTYLPRSGAGGTPGFTNARRIINGTDKAHEIAVIANKMQLCLQAGDWR